MEKTAFVRRSWLAACAGLWAAVAPVAAAAADGGRVLDRVVAAVDGRAITLSELSLEARVALVQRGGMEGATAPLDDELLSSALDVVIGQRVLLVEADRLGAFSVEEQD